MLVGCAICARGLVGCSPYSGVGAFRCESDPDCQGAADGQCEPTGFCSFADSACPDGRRYGDLSGGLAGQCVSAVALEDASVGAEPIGDDLVCFGSDAGLVEPCFAVEPAGEIVLDAAIDTDGAQCQAVTNTTACVIAGATIEIPAGATVTVSGSKPLVLVAVTTVTINGKLDLASKRAGAIGAAANPASCTPGTLPTDGGANGGGGAGGSNGAIGGTGGNGTNSTGGQPGTALALALSGGCKGQDGAIGGGDAATVGLAGNGGGAVYVIARTSIEIGAAGVINASGAAGSTGLTQLAGGGGGGAGGLIGLESPLVINNGFLLANGGAGGEGANDAASGRNGTDQLDTTTAPGTGGTGGTVDGGNGGNGGSVVVGDGVGRNGGTSADGGGAGGGVGFIKVISANATLGANVSPAAQ
jgi:hypothetical protein